MFVRLTLQLLDGVTMNLVKHVPDGFRAGVLRGVGIGRRTSLELGAEPCRDQLLVLGSPTPPAFHQQMVLGGCQMPDLPCHMRHAFGGLAEPVLRGDTIEQTFGLKSSDAELLDDEVKTGHRHLRDDCDAENAEVFRIVADSHPHHNATMIETRNGSMETFNRRSCPIGSPGFPGQGPSTVENKPDMNRLSRWGVGPSIVLVALSYAAIGAIMTYLWSDTYLIRAIPYPVFLVTGASLLVIGVPMLVVAAVALTRNYDRDQLATRGIYGS